MDEIKYKPIGVIHSPFKEPEGTPIQPAGAKDINGTVEVFPEYAEGLKDLEGFSHIILIYHFHLSKKSTLKVKPYMDNESHGVFAMRGPSRPNPVGISVGYPVFWRKTLFSLFTCQALFLKVLKMKSSRQVPN